VLWQTATDGNSKQRPMNFPPLRSFHRVALMLALFAVCMVAYLGGLGGGFQFDDYQVIVYNDALHSLMTNTHHWLLVALSTNSGPLRRPVSMLTFGLNVAWFGMNPMAFKLVNLGIHLFSGGLIYAIGRQLAARLTGSMPCTAIKPEMLALLAVGLWLLHPLNVSGVLYIVQRMNELAALFMLCGLWCYVDGRERMLAGESALVSAIAAVCLFGVLAVFSKENGVLIAAYALVIEATCYRFEASSTRERRALQGFFGIGVGLPAAAFVAFLATHAHWLTASYAGRDFTLYQRLLSEARILCDYLLWIFVPNPAWMGLYHDDIATSTGLFSPTSTAFAIVFLLAAVIAAWKLRRRHPGVTFAIAWFLIGHSMESTILPLELVFEHRNYLPMAGLLLGSVCALAPLIPADWNRRWIAAACTVLLLGLAGLTAMRAASWGNPLTMALDDARHHPDSSRDQYAAGRALIFDGASRNERLQAEQQAIPYFRRSALLDHNSVYAASNLMFIMSRTQTIAPIAIADLADRLRTTPSYVQANPFFDLLNNATTQKLTLTPADISTLTQAALANPHFPAMVRAMIMSDYGAYLFNAVGDHQGGINLTVAAAATDPANPYFVLRLATLALAVGDSAKAGQYLDAATRLDKVNTYSKQIDELRLRLQ